MKPLVSIVTPVYNAAAFLEETLQSILASSYPNLEVILMDDGSGDNSVLIAQDWAEKDARIKVFMQRNAGPAAARNNAIKHAKGKYILPIDADDLLHPNYIEQAVEVLENNSNVKVVGCNVEMFGDRTGMCKYPPYSLSLLARKNMIPISAMYRKEDWERVGGYCEDIIAREDWEFWIAMLKDGGDYIILPITGLKYRIRANSKRLSDRKLKRHVVNTLNKRHSDFFQRELGGPLHYRRTWSRLINCFRSEKIVGDIHPAQCFAWAEKELHRGRNTIRQIDDVVIKRFATPNILRGIIYGMFCKSKARRSYEYALKMQGLTPQPLAYQEVRICGILRESYYACKASECVYTFNDLINNYSFSNRDQILTAIGRFTAQLHKQGIMHHDYSGGNILFDADGSKVEMVDLNRVHFYKRIGFEQGCQNFERLNIDKSALRIMAKAYAQERGFNAQECAEYIIQHRWYKHVKQGITNL